MPRMSTIPDGLQEVTYISMNGRVRETRAHPPAGAAYHVQIMRAIGRHNCWQTVATEKTLDAAKRTGHAENVSRRRSIRIAFELPSG